MDKASAIKRFFSKKITIYGGLALLLVIAISVFAFGNGNGRQIMSVKRMEIVQEVASTGKIKPNQSVDLGFDKSGRVSQVYVSVGDNVKKGQVIASLEAGEIYADLTKAKASLSEEQIKLSETQSTAPTSYSDASKNLDAAIKEGFADADNAIRNRVDQFFSSIPDNPHFELSFTSGNFVHYFDVPDDTVIELNSERKNIESILTDWQKRISGTSTNLSAQADKAIADLNVVSGFLDKMAKAVNAFSPAEYAYETTISNYKTTISSARSEVSGAISSIVTAKDKLNSAPILSDYGEFESVLTQESKVKQAEASVSSLEASLEKYLIRAPFDGVVTLQDAKPGAAVSPGTTLVSVISQDQMYVEANISEINIGKIADGNSVLVDFDAFPGEVFPGEVAYIEPGDVLIDGVVNYKVRVKLQNADPKIKTGLTANLKIQTSKKENTLAIPIYAVTKESGQDFVNKVEGEKTVKTPVTLGIVGNNGFVEVLSGLSEGDNVEF